MLLHPVDLTKEVLLCNLHLAAQPSPYLVIDKDAGTWWLPQEEISHSEGALSRLSGGVVYSHTKPHLEAAPVQIFAQEFEESLVVRRKSQLQLPPCIRQHLG